MAARLAITHTEPFMSSQGMPPEGPPPHGPPPQDLPLKGSRTETLLQQAFASEAQANRRYLYFAQTADIEGHVDIAAVFRSTAEGETGHAFGHLDYLRDSGDPVTGLRMGSTAQHLAAAIAGETQEYADMYPGMARVARDEGFEEIADWFETLAKAERSHAHRFRKALEALEAAEGTEPGSEPASDAGAGAGTRAAAED